MRKHQHTIATSEFRWIGVESTWFGGCAGDKIFSAVLILSLYWDIGSKTDSQSMQVCMHLCVFFVRVTGREGGRVGSFEVGVYISCSGLGSICWCFILNISRSSVQSTAALLYFIVALCGYGAAVTMLTLMTMAMMI